MEGVENGDDSPNSHLDSLLLEIFRTAAAIAKEANIPRERIFAGVLPKQKVCCSLRLHGCKGWSFKLISVSKTKFSMISGSILLFSNESTFNSACFTFLRKPDISFVFFIFHSFLDLVTRWGWVMGLNQKFPQRTLPSNSKLFTESRRLTYSLQVNLNLHVNL